MPDREYLSVIGWDQVHHDVHKLAEEIMDSEFEPDVIVGVGYGGIIPSTLMYFALPEVKFRIAYPKASNHEVIEPLPELKGRKVLLVDDLAISGDSLMEIKQQILNEGATSIVAACLYCSPEYHDLDHFIRRLEPGELIVFPWYTVKEPSRIKVFKYKNRFGKHEPKEYMQ